MYATNYNNDSHNDADINAASAVSVAATHSSSSRRLGAVAFITKGFNSIKTLGQVVATAFTVTQKVVTVAATGKFDEAFTSTTQLVNFNYNRATKEEHCDFELSTALKSTANDDDD
jgi:hypothetical protein